MALVKVQKELLTASSVGTQQIENQSITRDKLSSDSIFGKRNAIFNGNFDYWPIGSSFAAASDTQILAAQWKFFKVGTAVHTISASTDVPTVTQSGTFSSNSLLVTTTTAQASLSASDYFIIDTAIEGFEFRKLAQRQMVLSFWVKATKTGIYSVSFMNGSGDRSFVSEYTISSSNTWEKKTILISQSPSDGTWNYGSGVGLRIRWSLAAGNSNKTSATNSWQSIQRDASTNQVNSIDAVNNEFRLAQVQLETGNVATRFEDISYNDEIMRCSRYIFVPVTGSEYPFTGAYIPTSGVFGVRWMFPVSMRTSPTQVNTLTDVEYNTANGWVFVDSTASVITKTGTISFGAQANPNWFLYRMSGATWSAAFNGILLQTTRPKLYFNATL